jgi:superfamily II DNA or RNA helicase
MNDNKQLRDYQKEAIQKLNKHYLTKDKGMLVLPTGAGKTFTAAKFVSTMFHSKQWDKDTTLVIWLAHTIELIKQTKGVFESEFDNNRISVISSQTGHDSWGDLNKKQYYNRKNLIFASYLSCSKMTKRKGKYRKDYSLDEMKFFVKNSGAKNVFLVIDEAHRATAKTYRNILDGLNELKDQKNKLDSVKLLGLTATPIRMSQMEQETLHHLFDSNKIYEISTLELQNKGILSKLYPVKVATGNTEVDLFKVDYDAFKPKLDQYKSLTQEMLNKIGESFTRNQLIVDHYIANREQYGPTLVFATSIMHCETLVDYFKKSGVKKCAAIHSDYKDFEIEDRLAQFKIGELDVLVNVNMLTEGVDIPNAKTVFLTRPTNSEALLRQMVGRVLRGESSNGTEIAFAVDFEDSWDKFSPISAGYLFKGENHELEVKEYHSLLLNEKIPIEIILEISRIIKQEQIINISNYIPLKYYCWKKEQDGELLNNNLITYDNWDYALQKAIDKVKSNPNIEINAVFFNEELKDCVGPIPRSERDFKTVLDLLEVMQNDEDYEVYLLDDIVKWSPSKILERYKGKDKLEIGKDIKELFDNNDFLKNQYQSANDLYIEILKLPQEIESNKNFKTDYKQWNKPNKDYEIQEVYERVLKSNNKFKIDLEIQKRLIFRYSCAPELPSAWGFCQEEPYFDKIINVVLSPRLNAPDIPLIFLEFIMYHELVHVKIGNKEGHNQKFLELESLFIPSILAINDLRFKFEKYNKRISKKYTFYNLCKELQGTLCK